MASSCSGTAPQMADPMDHEEQQVAAAPAASADADAPNGQHHLLRHVLSPQQCSDALRHFGTADSKAAARMVNRMSQRELRDMFQKVYSVHTNSNNNTWLRRKLLEAVGASRRFYTAANRTGRPKARRGGDGGDKPKPRGGGGAARGSKAAAAAAAGAPGTPGPAASAAALPQPQPQARQAHHALPAGPPLPAGSPRALSHRLRLRSYGETHFTQHFRSVLQAAQAAQPDGASEAQGCGAPDEETTGSERSASDVHAHHYHHHRAPAPFTATYDPPASVFAAQQQALRAQHAAAAGGLYSPGSNNSLHSTTCAFPASPSPRAPFTPTSAAAPFGMVPQPPPAAAAGALQFGQQYPMQYGQQYGQQYGGIADVAVAAAPPRMGPLPSLTQLTQLLAGGLIAEQQAAAAAAAAAAHCGAQGAAPLAPQPPPLVPQQLASAPSLGLGLGLGGAASLPLLPSVDLGATLFSGTPLAEQPPAGKQAAQQESGEGEEPEMLCWDDWTLPALF